jgi:hypothetical protein
LEEGGEEEGQHEGSDSEGRRGPGGTAFWGSAGSWEGA